MRTLQGELNKSQTETAAKAQAIKAQLLQEQAFLKKQLSEPDVRLLGEKGA